MTAVTKDTLHKRSQAARVVEAISIIGFGVSLGIFLYWYPSLPQNLPLRNTVKNAASPIVLTDKSVLFQSFLIAFLAVAATSIASRFSTLNITSRFPITPENKTRRDKLAQLMCVCIGLAFAIMKIGYVWEVVRQSMAGAPRIDTVFFEWFLGLGCIGSLFLFGLFTYVKR